MKTRAPAGGGKLAACAQLLPIESFYSWKGTIRNDNETLLPIKTRAALLDAAIASIMAVHSYTVPEILALPFAAGFRDTSPGSIR